MPRRPLEDIVSGDQSGNEDMLTSKRHKRVAKSSARLAMASLACETCRGRKSKCDERRPKCSQCERLQLICEYRVPTMKTEQAVKEILDAVQRIEEKLDTSARSTGSLDVMVDNHQRQSSSIASFPDDPVLSYSMSQISESASQGGKDEWDSASPQLAIPYRHTTAAEKLLSWPIFSQLRALSDVDIRYPLRMAIARDTSSYNFDSTTHHPCLVDNLTYEDMTQLTDSYFHHFHTSSPVIDLELFKTEILPKLHGGWSADDQIGEDYRCLCLFVFALGSLAMAAQNGTATSDNGRLLLLVQDGGLGFLHEGKERLNKLAKTRLITAQCFLLSGEVSLFHSRNFESLQYYWAVNQACSILMVLLASSSTLGIEGERIFWVAYLQESGILAELDFPPSGISKFENDVPLPFSGLQSSSEPESDWPFFFLAQIALRRLLNRIHSSLYNQDLYRNHGAANYLVPSLSVISELNQQLEQWRCHLPPTLQFPVLSNDDITWDLEGSEGRLAMRGTSHHRTTSARANLIGHLRGRYCAAKTILFRPFAFKTLHSSMHTYESEDYDALRMCLLGGIWVALGSRVGTERLPLLQNPLNPCRSFYAAAILCKVIAATPHLQDCLPRGWKVMDYLQQAIQDEAVTKSPIIQRDLEILELLDMEFSSRSSVNDDPWTPFS